VRTKLHMHLSPLAPWEFWGCMLLAPHLCMVV
jgi:hypothetical protein